MAQIVTAGAAIDASSSAQMGLVDVPLRRTSKKVWIIVTILALLIHALIIAWNPPFNSTALRPPLEVGRVDAQDLEKIRHQWRERQLLISKNRTPPDRSVEAPKDARYSSDRNIRVEKEQRARMTDVLPKPNTGSAASAERAQSRPTRPHAVASPAARLSDLGVPFRLDAPPPEEQDQTKGQTTQAGSPGADQALLDRSLPEGSQNMLNAVESKYYSFYSRLYEAIGPIWQSRIRSTGMGRNLAEGDYTTVVELILDAKGEIVDVRLIQSSRMPEFDRVAQEAWHQVGRFPNPPKDLQDANGYVRTAWTFTVSVDKSFRVMTPDPERLY